MFNVNRVKKFSINGYNNCWAVSLELGYKKRKSRVVLTAGHNVYNKHEGKNIRKDILIGKARDLTWKIPFKFIREGSKEFDLAFTKSRDHNIYSKSTTEIDKEAFIACHLVKDYNGNTVSIDKVEMGLFPISLNKSPGSSLYEFPLGFTGISGSAVFNKKYEFMGIVCGLGTHYGSKEKQTNRGIIIPTASIISIINNGERGENLEIEKLELSDNQIYRPDI